MFKEKEGIAIAYKNSKLELLDSQIINLSDLKNFKGSMYDYSNQGMFNLFRHLGSGVVFVCCNCHLHFNAKIDYVRYAQIVFLMHLLNSFIEKAMVSQSL
jgi:hypothetical protein